MDNAVALVETYLRVNGYFTVTEYPVLEANGHGGLRTATDLDVIAFRFPGAGRLVAAGVAGREPQFAPDPELGGQPGEPDMIIAEVKEGKAELNEAAGDPAVLQAALTRFGCCEPRFVRGVVDSLLRHGEARTHCNHRVRLLAFGSITTQSPGRKYRQITLGHVTAFLRKYVCENWAALRHAQFKDPVFGWLVMEQKAGVDKGV